MASKDVSWSGRAAFSLRVKADRSKDLFLHHSWVSLRTMATQTTAAGLRAEAVNTKTYNKFIC